MATKFGGRFWRGMTGGDKWLKDHAAFFLKAAGVIYVIREHVMELTVCVGPSMMPTFNPYGDVAFVEHISVELGLIRPGDVVIARSVQNPRHVVCKRVLGLEGDVVPVNEGGLFGVTHQVQVPKGHVWLQGDNLHNSTDSRQYGPVPYALLRGRVVAKIWPLWDAGFIRRGPPPYPPPIMR